MLKYQFDMMVMGSSAGPAKGRLLSITTEDPRHKFKLLEADKEGNSSSLGEFLSTIFIANKTREWSFGFNWVPSERYQSTFISLKKEKGTVTRFSLDLNLVDGDGNAKWKDRLELKTATVVDAGRDERDGSQWVKLRIPKEASKWDEITKDQSE